MYVFPIYELTQKKVSDLHLSATDPPMYLSIERNEYDKSANTHFFIIEVGVQKEANFVTKHTLRYRYSQLLQLDQQLQSFFKENNIINPFPPKNYFRSNSELFVQKRQEDLQKYLDILTKTPDIIKVQAFRDYFELD